MTFDMLLDLLSDGSLIALAAYLIGRSSYIVNCSYNPYRLRNFATLVAIFSALSITGTYSGIPVHGALANTRLVGTLMGGIMGGPWVGLGVGLISGFHRYLLGGFTAEICGLSAVIGGLLAGLVRSRIGLYQMNWKAGAIIALVAEIIQKSLVLLFAKPFESAWALEKAIAVPTTLVSVLGTVIFIMIIQDLQKSRNTQSAQAAELSLEIASKTLPYLRHGLTPESAQKTAEIVYELTKVDSVAITDKEKILACIGLGSDHHKVGESILTSSTKKVLENPQLLILNTAEDRGCAVENCPLRSGVAAPLYSLGVVVGTIKLSRAETNSVNAMDIRLVEGLANLLSTQIQLAEIDYQKKLREKAELQALQAQINPHFLYNTLGTIMSFCRTNPDTARTLLAHLATIMQRSFSARSDFITLKDEMDGIIAYLEIAKPRFGPRLKVDIRVDEYVQQAKIPVLTVQPLVENALEHGLFPKIKSCRLSITATQEGGDLVINIEDNGVGISATKLKTLLTANSDGIGVKNVYKRLGSIYGGNYGLTIHSQPAEGTQAIIRIPFERRITA
jgi:two-component system sensor histidine kinase LytS